MKYIHSAEINSFDIGSIKKHEPVFLRIESDNLKYFFENTGLNFLLKKTSLLTVSVQIENIPLFLKKISLDDSFCVCVRRIFDNSYIDQIYDTGPHIKPDRLFIDQITEYQKLYPRLRFAVEYDLPSCDLRLLGDCVATMYELNIEQIYLAPMVKDEKMIEALKDLFDYFRLRSLWKLNVYFSFHIKERESLQIKTLNTFSGIRTLQIDISNKCTHSCHFCAVYSENSLALKKDRLTGKLNQISIDFMKMQISAQQFYQILYSIPNDTEFIQLGGAGDPMTHPEALPFIQAALDRGLQVEVLTNLDYITEEQIKNLSSSIVKDDDLHFICNISGGNAADYVLTRPRQSEKTFQQIKNLLLYIKSIKKMGAPAPKITVMCVVTSLNCENLDQIALFAQEVSAEEIWFKPMEIHANELREFIPKQSQFLKLKQSLTTACDIAKQHDILVSKLENYKDFISEGLQ